MGKSSSQDSGKVSLSDRSSFVTQQYEKELRKNAALTPEQFDRKRKLFYRWFGGPDWSGFEREQDL